MNITVGEYKFEGPYTDATRLENRSGVYVIHCYRGQGFYLIDVGEATKIKERLDNHDRKDCWNRECMGTLTVSVLYTPNLKKAGRMEIEQDIRDEFDPPCGED